MRDLFWLTAVVGLGIGWWLDHRSHGEQSIAAPVVDFNRTDLIEVDIGTKDGLQVGQVMQLYRRTQRLGEITIRAVNTDRAVGQFRGQLRRPRIQKGDTAMIAASQLSSQRSSP